MALLQSRVERTDEFARRHGRMEALVAELRERTAQVAAGGGERARSSGTARVASCSARERIDRLVDPGTAFLELNALAAWDVYDDAGAERPGSSPGSASSRAASA